MTHKGTASSDTLRIYETYLKKSGKNSILRICIWFNTPIFLSRDIEVKSCKKIHYNFVQKVFDTYGIRTRLVQGKSQRRYSLFQKEILHKTFRPQLWAISSDLAS